MAPVPASNWPAAHGAHSACAVSFWKRPAAHVEPDASADALPAVNSYPALQATFLGAVLAWGRAGPAGGASRNHAAEVYVGRVCQSSAIESKVRANRYSCGGDADEHQR